MNFRIAGYWTVLNSTEFITKSGATSLPHESAGCDLWMIWGGVLWAIKYGMLFNETRCIWRCVFLRAQPTPHPKWAGPQHTHIWGCLLLNTQNDQSRYNNTFREWHVLGVSHAPSQRDGAAVLPNLCISLLHLFVIYYLLWKSYSRYNNIM